MKQALQNLKSGQVSVADVPRPLPRDGGILVANQASLISAGTERMIMNLARKGLLGKAKERPDLVRKVMAKLRRDGFLATFQSVRDKLDTQIPLGYSACGEVIEVGSQAGPFAVGQRVACAGAGYANHAEVNYVPRLLAVPVPEGVASESAAYATVGAIALQGVRNADVRVGETVAVIGLGLIGQLSVQLLSAAGCRVVGLDVADHRVELARAHGADLAIIAQKGQAERETDQFTRGRGVDAVLITAATKSNEPIEMAARLARDRARVVMVGVTGMDIPRKSYFQKELTFIVSRSYGPGRYDRQYEEHGHDYPAGYVRWTENRNIEAFVDLLSSGAIRPEVCTTHRFPINDAPAAFDLVLTGREPYLGIVLTYPQRPAERGDDSRIVLPSTPAREAAGRVGVSMIGAGSFARSVLLPALAQTPEVQLRGVVTASGISARAVGEKYGFAFCGSAESEVYTDDDTTAVLIATRHSQHAGQVCHALEAGKAVFVEKPLAITLSEVRQLRQALTAHPHGLLVGFNRRFSPLAAELKEFLDSRGPITALYRCNAGPLPSEHWLADPAEGGRILGEGCHFFDFFAYLTGASPQTVYAAASPGSVDDAVVSISYADGSQCQLVYTSAGPPSFSKERLEVFAGGSAAVLEDFRRLELHPDSGRTKRRRSFRADKGHRQEIAAFLAALTSGSPMPISPESLIETTLVGLAALQSIRHGEPVTLDALREETREDAPDS